ERAVPPGQLPKQPLQTAARDARFPLRPPQRQRSRSGRGAAGAPSSRPAAGARVPPPPLPRQAPRCPQAGRPPDVSPPPRPRPPEPRPAAAPPPHSNASAASRSPSSSRRRRGVSFPARPLPRNRSSLAVSRGPSPGGAGGHHSPSGLARKLFGPEMGVRSEFLLASGGGGGGSSSPVSRRLSPTAATAAAPSLLSLLPAPSAALSSVKSRPPPLPGTPDPHQDPRGPLNYRPPAPGPGFRAGKGWKSPLLPIP
ncbi:hypothetical protein MC885_005019, partial [Smutsia gigantea]